MRPPFSSAAARERRGGGVSTGPNWPCLALFTPSREAENGAVWHSVVSFGTPPTRTLVGQPALVVALFGLVGVGRSGETFNSVPFRSVSFHRGHLGPLSHLCRAPSFRSNQEWGTPIPWPWPDLARFARNARGGTGLIQCVRCVHRFRPPLRSGAWPGVRGLVRLKGMVAGVVSNTQRLSVRNLWMGGDARGWRGGQRSPQGIRLINSE